MENIKVVEYINEYGLIDKWTYKGTRLIKTETEYPKVKNNKLNNKTKTMSAKQELFEQIAEQFSILKWKWRFNKSFTSKSS